MDLEEHSIEHLPDRCQSCGNGLTDAEKIAALESGASLVLCTTCATEQAPPPEEGEDAEY
jgi:hypothetical protein